MEEGKRVIKVPQSGKSEPSNSNSDADAKKRVIKVDKYITDKYKKKSSDSGEYPSSAEEPLADTPSTSDIEIRRYNFSSINQSDISKDLLDRFYSESGITPVYKKIELYKSLVNDGVDPVSAASTSGLKHNVERGEKEDIVQPYIADEDIAMQEKALLYIQNNYSDELENRTRENIRLFTDEFKSSKRTTDDFNRFYANVSDQVRELSKYTRLGDSEYEDKSDREILEEFRMMTAPINDMWNLVIDKPVKKTYSSMYDPLTPFQEIYTPDYQATQFTRDIKSKEAERGFFENLFGDDSPELSDLRYKHDLIGISRNLSANTNSLLNKIDKGIVSAGIGGLAGHFENYVKTLESLTQRDGLKKFQEKMAMVGMNELTLDDLSDEELMLMNTMITSSSVIDRYKNKVPLKVEVADAVGKSVGFMLEMFTTAGIGSAAGQAAKTSILSLSANRLAPSIINKMAANTVGVMTQAAVQTSAMPSFVERSASRYSLGENLPNAIVGGYMDTYTDVVSEKIFQSKLPKLKSNSALHIFWNRTNSAFGNATDIRSMVDAGFKEYFEEIFAGTIQAYREDGLPEVGRFMADTRQQAVTAYSIAAMVGFGAGANVTSKLRHQYGYEKYGKQLGDLRENIDAILSEENISVEQAITAIDEVVASHGVDNNLEGEKILENRKNAIAYAGEKFTLESYDPNSFDRGDWRIEDNEYVKKPKEEKKTEAQTILVKGEGFVIEDGVIPTVRFEGQLNQDIDDMYTGKSMSIESLTNIENGLNEVKKHITDKETVSTINEFISRATELKKDLKSSEQIIDGLREKAGLPSTATKAKKVTIENQRPVSMSESSVLKTPVETSEHYDIVADDVEVGEVVVDKATSEWAIKWVKIDEGQKRKGYATKVYQSLATEAAKANAEVYSDIPSKMSSDAKALWKSLSDSGKAIRMATGRYKMNTQKVSRAKLPSQKPVKTVQVNEMAALRDQIRLESKAAKGAVLDQKKMLADVSKSVKELVDKGKITTRQASTMLTKMANTNMANPVLREKFIQYADKVFQKASNAQELKIAKDTGRRLRKQSKNKKNNAAFRSAAQDFMHIDPRLVDDVTLYNKMAQQLIQGMTSSRVNGSDIIPTKHPFLGPVKEYIDTELTRQEPIVRAMKAQLSEDIAGVVEIEKELEEMADAKAADIKERVSVMLDTAKDDVKSMLDSGVDPVTGEALDITPRQREIVEKFMDVKVDDFTVREALRVIDSLNNFVVNHDTSGMGATINYWEGVQNAKKMRKAAITFKFGIMDNFMAKNIASFPMLIENLFKGMDNATEFWSNSSVRDYINGRSKAIRQAKEISDKYYDKFNKKKPNNKGFLDHENIIERAIYGYVSRSRVGSQEDVAKEYQQRKRRIETSIRNLENGSKSQQDMAKAIQTVYNKVLSGVDSLSELEGNINNINKEAVNWWRTTWESLLPDLQEISTNIYNRVIEADNFYIPDVIHKVNAEPKIADLDVALEQSAFDMSTRGIYGKESSVLTERKKYNDLSEKQYISMDFDKNMHKILNQALADLYTAEATKRMQGFFNSENMNRIFPDKATRDIVKARVTGLVLETRGKYAVTDNEAMIGERKLALAASYGAGRALGKVAMAIQQTVPVMTNTLINAGNLDFSIMFDESQMAVVNGSGRAISIRGAESMGAIMSVEEAAGGGLSEGQKEKAFKTLNDFILNNFLVKPDIWIAKISWMTYYKQSLKAQGVDVGKIDWSAHKINDKAADYAQDMVDRQQNVSDAALLGDFLRSRDPYQAFLRKAMLPFANFMLNQKMRMATDIVVITSKFSSNQNKAKALRSLTGAVMEQAMFHAISQSIAELLFNGAAAIIGYRDTEEEAKARIKRRAGLAGRNWIQDIISPFPIVDDLALQGLSTLFKATDVNLGDYEIPVHDYVRWYDFLGMYGIGVSKMETLAKMIDMSTSDSYTSSYMGRDTKKFLYEEDAKVMRIALAAYSLYLLGAPAEIGTMANDIMKMIDKESISESRMKKYEKKKYGEPYEGREEGKRVSRIDMYNEIGRETRSPTNVEQREIGGQRTR